MKLFLVACALAGSALAQGGYAEVLAEHQGSPIHLQPLTARNGKFYINAGPPTSNCPPSAGDACAGLPGNITVFTGSAFTGPNGILSLDVVVPGGQQVYIDPDGWMSYTAPHSAYMPPGSDTSGWGFARGIGLSAIDHDGGIAACPVGQTGAYQVLGKYVDANSTCVNFYAITYDDSGSHNASAWEYT